MCPVLFSIPGPPTWAAVLLCLIFGAAAFALEAHEQRRLGTWQNRPRLALMTLVGVAFAFAISFALRRWGPVPVRSWGTMLMVGFLAGLAWVIWDTRDDDDVDVDTLIDVTLAILVGAVLGSRLLAVALNWSDFAGRPEDILKVWEGGLSFHGGLVGGFGAAALYLWRRGMSIPRMADVLTPSVAIGYAFTRVGCFLNGCCHGSPSDLPWAIPLPHIPGNGLEGLPLHPAQLYGTLGSLIIFGLLLLIRGHLRRPGHLFLSYLILYSISRSIMEVFRAGASAEAFGPIPALTVAQFASICIGLGAAALMYATRCRTAPAEEDAASETEAAREASTESR
jgi:phosphatidylglycerol:prolipoprotein diacylglycerol transferase